MTTNAHSYETQLHPHLMEQVYDTWTAISDYYWRIYFPTWARYFALYNSLYSSNFERKTTLFSRLRWCCQSHLGLGRRSGNSLGTCLVSTRLEWTLHCLALPQEQIVLFATRFLWGLLQSGEVLWGIWSPSICLFWQGEFVSTST